MPIVFWSHTFDDLKTITNLHVQYENVKSLQFYEDLIDVASKIFGDGKGNKSGREPRSYAEAEAQIRALIG